MKFGEKKQREKKKWKTKHNLLWHEALEQER